MKILELIFVIVGSILLFFIVYDLIPNYISRNVIQDIKHNLNKNDKKIALTFDDGPDEKYTEQVLDILEQHEIKATFFVVANKALKNKSIIERMKKEGHTIALHSLKHKSAWIMTPIETLKEIPIALSILRSIGVKVDYFRPPWGTFNLFTYYTAKKNNLKVILWSVEAFDWRKNNSSDNISSIILKRVQKNTIIVLHDSGGAESAPINTIEALKILIPKLKLQGYDFVADFE